MDPDGLDYPEWFLGEPVLLPADEIYLEAFRELSTCRSAGMALGQIPWTALVQYAEYVEIPPSVLPGFVRILREMDNAYLKYHQEESNREAASAKAQQQAKAKVKSR